MSKVKMRRTSVTLPQVLVEDLDYLSKRMGISRSALITSLSVQPVHELREMVAAIPENPTQADLLRFRGKSAVIVSQRIEELKKLEEGDDLFPEN